jgi:hypothetical protein
MTRRFKTPSPQDLARVRALAERRLSPSEFDAYVNAPMSPEEKQEIHSLIEWFTRRYKTPAERLAWARRAHARWAPAMPHTPAHQDASPEPPGKTGREPVPDV